MRLRTLLKITLKITISIRLFVVYSSPGIATLDFQLGSEAKLGVWTIEVNVDESDAEKGDEESLGQFTVMEYGEALHRSFLNVEQIR